MSDRAAAIATTSRAGMERDVALIYSLKQVGGFGQFTSRDLVGEKIGASPVNGVRTWVYVQS